VQIQKKLAPYYVKNSINKLLFFGLLLGGIASCSNPDEHGTSIAFNLAEKGVYSVQMRNNSGEFEIIDTLEIIGSDVFSVRFDTARIVSFVPLEGELPVVHAVVGPESKSLSISTEGFISGDAENNWLGIQRKMQLDLIAFTDSLDALRSAYADSSTFKGISSLNDAFISYGDAYRQIILDTLAQRPNYLSNLLTVYHRIGQQPVLDYEVDRGILQNVYTQLSAKHPGSPDVITFAMWLAKYEEMVNFTRKVQEAALKFQPGHPFPELTLETPQGQEMRIKKMSLENNVIAVWASWCTGCRNELIATKKRGEKENWIYLSVDGLPSQRSPLADWYNAIKSDELGGIHLSDLKGGRSAIISALGIEGLPVYFKVENGIITQRLTSTEGLN